MKEVRCEQCPLRPLPLFLENSADEVNLVQSLKRREARLGAGETLIFEGQTDAPLYTLLDGWAFRFKTLRDGRRQILNLLLPGDFIGVQQKMGDVAAHGVMTLTEAVFCVFKRDSLWELHRQSPSMGFNVTWLTAHEESLVDDRLLSENWGRAACIASWMGGCIWATPRRWRSLPTCTAMAVRRSGRWSSRLTA